MSLEGTNSYLIAAAGHPGAAVVDPGPLDEKHLKELAAGSVVVFELSTTWGADYPGQLLRTLTVDAEPTQLYRELHDVAEAAHGNADVRDA